jgi:hypothetical protein
MTDGRPRYRLVPEPDGPLPEEAAAPLDVNRQMADELRKAVSYSDGSGTQFKPFALIDVLVKYGANGPFRVDTTNSVEDYT